MSFNGMNSDVVNEVIAVCNDLGHKNKHLDNKYILNRSESNNVIKDLIRYLRNDDKNEFSVRKQLGFTNIVDNDLIPIVEQYSLEDIPLFDKVLRLLVDLTNPTLLLFRQKTLKDRTESQKYLELQSFLYSYKLSFGSHKRFWAVLAKHLSRIVSLSEEMRQIEDTLMFERILILIRNVLHIPIDTNCGQTAPEDGTNPHDRIVEVLQSSGINDLILFLVNDDSHQDFCFHLIEIISLIFKEQNSEFIAKSVANYQQNGFNGNQRSDFEREVDRKELKELKTRDRSVTIRSHVNLNRFNGTFCIKNMKSISDRDIVCHKTPQHLSQISFDANKDFSRKRKAKQPITGDSVKSGSSAQVMHKSSPNVRKLLFDFCSDFLNNSYNQFMRQIRDNLNRNLNQDNDETYYLWAIQFFMEFNRTNPNINDCSLVSETMSISTFHYLQTQIDSYLESIKTKKEEQTLWSKRLHYGLKAYRELLFSLNYFSFAKEDSIRQKAILIKRNIFYEVEYRDLLLLLLHEYKETLMSKAFLKDLIETNHVFLKMIEHYYKSHSRLVIKEKVRKRKKPKKKKPKDKTPPEEIWNEIAITVSEALSGSLDLPSPQEDLTVRAFDPISDKSTDEQKMDVFRRIHNFLYEKRVVEAIALYRDARNCWTGDEDNAFGAQDIPPEDELLALNEVFMNDFPDERQEVEEEEKDEELEVNENIEQLAKTKEREIELKEVIHHYCVPNIVRNYALLLRSYDTNSEETNHCLIKMLHRIAFDNGMSVMLFQGSLFRTFQRILSDPLKDSTNIKELSKFVKFIVSKFVSIAQRNKKVFFELLFWKNSREAFGVEEGFDQVLNAKPVKQLWSEEQELELQVLFDEFKNKENNKEDNNEDNIEKAKDDNSEDNIEKAKDDNSEDNIEKAKEDNNEDNIENNKEDNNEDNSEDNIEKTKDDNSKDNTKKTKEDNKDFVDYIVEKLIDKTKTRRQVIRQLKQQGLIQGKYTKIKTKRVKRGKKVPKSSNELLSDESSDESSDDFPKRSSEEVVINYESSDEDIEKDNKESNVEELTPNENNENNENHENKDSFELSSNEENIENIGSSDHLVIDSEDSSDGLVALKIDESMNSNEKRSFDSDDEEIVVTKKKRRQLIIDDDD